MLVINDRVSFHLSDARVYCFCCTKSGINEYCSFIIDNQVSLNHVVCIKICYDCILKIENIINKPYKIGFHSRFYVDKLNFNCNFCLNQFNDHCFSINNKKICFNCVRPILGFKKFKENLVFL